MSRISDHVTETRSRIIFADAVSAFENKELHILEGGILFREISERDSGVCIKGGSKVLLQRLAAGLRTIDREHREQRGELDEETDICNDTAYQVTEEQHPADGEHKMVDAEGNVLMAGYLGEW